MTVPEFRGHSIGVYDIAAETTQCMQCMRSVVHLGLGSALRSGAVINKCI